MFSFVSRLVVALAYLGSGCVWAAQLEDIVQRVKPSVVAIGTFQATRSPQFQFRGTGFAVGDGLLVVTNAHVVPDKLDPDKREGLSIVIPGTSGNTLERREATLAAVDRDQDLALLRVTGQPLRALSLDTVDAAREGGAAAFTGFPIGSVLGLVPVTHRATISAWTPIAIPSINANHLNERTVTRLREGAFKVLQLDAVAYPGNSGSPLYDAATGVVLGIVNMVFVKSTKESALSQPSGISFAVPARYIAEMLTRYEAAQPSSPVPPR